MLRRSVSRELGSIEAAIYRWLVRPDAPKVLTLADTKKIVASKNNSLSHSMSSLRSKGILRKIGKGIYLNSSTGVLPKVPDVIPWVFRGSKYYLGLNAIANHWELSPQIPYSYQAIYSPRSDTEQKRITNWCSLLIKFERELGGLLIPVASRSSTGAGLSQSIMDGSQLPISSLERTIVDAVIYTREIGGAGEALLWTRAALVRRNVDYVELDKIVGRVATKLYSVSARLGFLLETAMDDKQVVERRSALDRFLQKLKKNAKRSRSTFNWGSEKTPSEYFENWHLHVSKSYLKQLKETSTFE